MDLGYILGGGFAKGYRTYIAAAVLVISTVASYAVGDTDLIHAIQGIATGLGLGSLRAAV